ncbi:hypothetical protein FIBSPDRAFT_880545 [Athelia psychrophila]|nr:hypothetical protein FIBSPDRAFT_880545 [Fibularhizoctonia sp. CBS 109695]
MRREELRVDSGTSRADVVVFIRTRLQDTRARKLAYLRKVLQEWPGGDEVDALATLAGGHFIWTQTACRLIDKGHNPKKRMTNLINDQSSFASSDSFSSLHLLYNAALQTTHQWADPSFCRDFRDILSVVGCAQEPLSCAAIDTSIVPRVPLQEECLPSLQTVSVFGSLLHPTPPE